MLAAVDMSLTHAEAILIDLKVVTLDAFRGMASNEKDKGRFISEVNALWEFRKWPESMAARSLKKLFAVETPCGPLVPLSPLVPLRPGRVQNHGAAVQCLAPPTAPPPT